MAAVRRRGVTTNIPDIKGVAAELEEEEEEEEDWSIWE